MQPINTIKGVKENKNDIEKLCSFINNLCLVPVCWFLFALNKYMHNWITDCKYTITI